MAVREDFRSSSQHARVAETDDNLRAIAAKLKSSTQVYIYVCVCVFVYVCVGILHVYGIGSL